MPAGDGLLKEMKKSEVNRNYIIGQPGETGVWLTAVKKNSVSKEFVGFLHVKLDVDT